MKTQYNTIQALAAAVAAYEHNQFRVERNLIKNNDSTIVPNRQLISDHLSGINKQFVVNEFHQKQAEGIVSYLQQTGLMQALTSRSDKFLHQINQLLLNDTVDQRNFGILAWAPKLSDDCQKKDHVREVSARYERTSRCIGQIGDKIQSSFDLIDSKYVNSANAYAVYGHDEHGNLIFYWAKDQEKIVKSGQIRGRIKQHDQNIYRGNAYVTTLHYVKML